MRAKRISKELMPGNRLRIFVKIWDNFKATPELSSIVR